MSLSNFVMFAFTLCFTSTAFAKAPQFVNVREVKSMKEGKVVETVDAVVDSILLGRSKTKDLDVRAVTTHMGPHTDVQPDYHLFLTFRNNGEWTSTRTIFDLGYVYKLKKAKRISGGVYELEVTVDNNEREKSDDESFLKDVTLRIDARKVFMDDAQLDREKFEEKYFETSIKVTTK